VVAIRGSVLTVPLVGWAPFHPPEALLAWAEVALHCRVVAVPLTTLLCFATRLTVGFAVLLPVDVVELPVAEGV
jgi:hypothetical protein